MMSFRQGRAVLEGKPWPAPRSTPANAPRAASSVTAGRGAGTLAPQRSMLVQTGLVPNGLAPTGPMLAPAASRRGLADSKAGHGGAILVAAYLFVSLSRVLDVAPALQTLHIPAILLTIMIILTVAGGRILHFLDTKIAWAELFMVGWICVAFLFSSWHAGGFDTLKLMLQSFLLFIGMAVLIQDLKGWLYAALGLALSAVVSSLLSFEFGKVMQAGRIAMDSGTLADPNEYALILLLTAPFWWILVRTAKHSKLAGVLAVALNVPVAIAFFRTGSRGGLISAAVLLVLVFVQARPAKKAALAIAAVAVLLSALAFLPRYLVERYETLFSNSDLASLSGETADALRADIDSSKARRDMLVMSLQRTLEHPIFGVGPGAFEAANWDAELKAGKRVGWQRSHNSYTQVSAELGIPGLCLFLYVLWCALSSLRRTARRTRGVAELQWLGDAASCVFVIMVAFCVGSFFLSIAFTPLVAGMLGLCASLEKVARQAFNARPTLRSA